MIDNEATRAWLDGLAQQNLGGPDMRNALRGAGAGARGHRQRGVLPGVRRRALRHRVTASRWTRGTSTSAKVGAMSPPSGAHQRPAVAVAPAPGRRPTGRHWTVLAIGGRTPPASPRSGPTRSPRSARMPLPRGTSGRRRGAGRPPGAGGRTSATAVVGWRLLLPAPRTPACGCAPQALELGAGRRRDSRWPAPRWPPARSSAPICRTVAPPGRVELGGTLPCAGCGCKLFVYYTCRGGWGTHLGFASPPINRGTQ